VETSETNETLFIKIQMVSQLACAKESEILSIFKKCYFLTHFPKMANRCSSKDPPILGLPAFQGAEQFLSDRLMKNAATMPSRAEGISL
jgi:hypothetical protein